MGRRAYGTCSTDNWAFTQPTTNTLLRGNEYFQPNCATFELRVTLAASNAKPRDGTSDVIRPVVVCPEISSPAQSFASVIKVPSKSCLPWRDAFCSFCFGSFGASSGSLRQQRKANARHSSTASRPARKVNMLDSRKHHHFRTRRQSSRSVGGSSVVSTDCSSSQPDIPSTPVYHPNDHQPGQNVTFTGEI
uniref:Uncharacterized protein n=1 Tax=Anopheles atroparvus TaxID=41427 RepID=A0A182IMJ7_ANOAO